MHSSLPKSIQDLVEYFSRLPGIGPKSATRHVFYLLQSSRYFQEQFGTALLRLSDNIQHCKYCFHFADEDVCSICSNPKREQEKLCIVETSVDILAIEKTNAFRGRYFVLGGVLSPMNGIGPQDIRISSLLQILEKSETEAIQEIILALPSTMEGEATAHYLFQKISNLSDNKKISRIARGIPLGSEIQYADENTLARAFEGRQIF